MKGLLLKDLYQLRRYAKLYILYAVVFGGITIVTGEPSFFGAMAAVLIFSLPLSAFNSDEHYGWHKQALAMPLSRNTIVQSKYLLTGICLAGSLVLQLVISLICSLTKPRDIISLTIGGLTSTLMIGLLMAVLLPFILKLGVEKGRILMMVLFGGIFVVIMAGSALALRFNEQGSMSDVSGWLMVGGMAAALVVVWVISYICSCKIFAKKEF